MFIEVFKYLRIKVLRLKSSILYVRKNHVTKSEKMYTQHMGNYQEKSRDALNKIDASAVTLMRSYRSIYLLQKKCFLTKNLHSFERLLFFQVMSCLTSRYIYKPVSFVIVLFVSSMSRQINYTVSRPLQKYVVLFNFIQKMQDACGTSNFNVSQKVKKYQDIFTKEGSTDALKKH